MKPNLILIDDYEDTPMTEKQKDLLLEYGQFNKDLYKVFTIEDIDMNYILYGNKRR